MPPAPTKPMHRGAAHIDLEAQQRVAHEVGQHLRQHGVARHLRPAGAGGQRALDRLHVDVLDDLGELLAERAQRVDARRASTPGSGPSPKAMTKTSAKTSSGTVRQNSQTAPHDQPQRSGARRTTLAADEEAEQEGADRPEQRADIGHQQRLAEQAGASAAGPRTTRPESGPDRLGPGAGFQREQPVEIARRRCRYWPRAAPGETSADTAASSSSRSTTQATPAAVRRCCPARAPVVGREQRR